MVYPSLTIALIGWIIKTRNSHINKNCRLFILASSSVFKKSSDSGREILRPRFKIIYEQSHAEKIQYLTQRRTCVDWGREVL